MQLYNLVLQALDPLLLLTVAIDDLVKLQLPFVILLLLNDLVLLDLHKKLLGLGLPFLIRSCEHGDLFLRLCVSALEALDLELESPELLLGIRQLVSLVHLICFLLTPLSFLRFFQLNA